MPVLLTILLILFFGAETHADIYSYTADDGSLLFTNATMDKSGHVFIKEKKHPGERHKENSAQDNGREYARPVINRESIHSIVEEKSKMHNIDPQLVKAVIRTESNFNPYALSPKGAQGLMQLMPGTASLLGVINPFDPAENIDGGIRYLKFLLEKFEGNLTLALAAYNAGPKLVEKRKAVPSIPETVAYVKRVIAYYSGEDAAARVSQTEIKKAVNRIKKLIQEDGTILFTNSFYASSSLENQTVR